MNLGRLVEEIKKFFKVPKNLIFMIGGPLFFTIFFGMVYSNDYLNDVPMAILDMDKSPTSRMIVKAFDDNQRYIVDYYPSNTEELKDIIREKKAFVGVMVPPNFEKDIKAGKGTKAVMLVDGSDIAVGNNALATGLEILNTVNGGINMKVLKGKNVPPKLSENYAKLFNFNSRVLYDPKLSYKYYVMPGMVIVLVQQLFLSVFVPNFVEDRRNIVFKSMIHIAVGIIAYGVCLIALDKIVGVKLMGNISTAMGFMGVYLTCLLGVALTIGSLFRDRLKVTQFCMMMSLPTFLTAGYMWPMFMMPNSIKLIVKSIWPLIYIVTPLRDYLIKGQFPNGFASNMVQLVIFGAVWFVLGYMCMKLMFKKEYEGEEEVEKAKA